MPMNGTIVRPAALQSKMAQCIDPIWGVLQSLDSPDDARKVMAAVHCRILCHDMSIKTLADAEARLEAFKRAILTAMATGANAYR